jgi:type II secretory pathway pseudopilin PulG
MFGLARPGSFADDPAFPIDSIVSFPSLVERQSPMSKAARLGFSLLDVIILVAIVAVLGIILVPSVHRMRDSAQQKVTQNNLRQCAIAIHNYHGVFNAFADAASTGGIYREAGEERTMWFHLLPYIEQDAAYKDNVHNAVVEAYLTPDDASKEDQGGSSATRRSRNRSQTAPSTTRPAIRPERACPANWAGR